VRIALAQINTVVGDIAGNEELILRGIEDARQAQAQLVVFPELAITGYPPEDLLLKEHFLAGARAALERIAEACTDVVAIVGFPERAEDAYNSAALCANDAVQAIYRKMHLPNYGVFDELRYFQKGETPAIFELDGVKIGITICEDVWVPGSPENEEALAGATLIVNLSASPYDHGKDERRERMIAQRAADELAAFAYCALVGGQDELIFDGGSFVCDHKGRVIARSPQFTEDLLICDVDTQAARSARLRDTRARPPAREGRSEVAHFGSYEVGGPHQVEQPGGELATPSTTCRRSTRRSSSARATTSARTASRTWCWACRAASTRRSSR
jgi:NAD+ synthase (glutamine-hydrolysing)